MEIKPLPKNRPYRILFIGNSYTYYNRMPEDLFAAIARCAGYEDVCVSAITQGGFYLDGHADPTTETGARIDAALAHSEYDFVVLQDHSVFPILYPQRFRSGARALAEKVRANGAVPLLYCTWGRKTGSETLAQHGWTNESMTWMLEEAYSCVGRELDIAVACVGRAFHQIYTDYPTQIDLYDADLTHPSAAGSYLAALTIFAKMFGVDPETVAYNGGLDPDCAGILKHAAKNTLI